MRIGPRKSSMWTPRDLFRKGEAGAWYDGADTSTMFQDSAGTATRVTAINGPVGFWADKSGNGNNQIQATAGLRPLYTTFGLLGDRATGKYTQCTALSKSIAGTTMYCIGAINANVLDNSASRLVSMSGAGADTAAGSCIPFLREGTNNVLASYQNGAYKSLKAITAATKMVAETMFDRANNTIWVNGSPGTIVAYSDTFAITNITLFSNAGVFGASITASIAEMIIIDRVPTAFEVSKARAYLSQKWSISLS